MMPRPTLAAAILTTALAAPAAAAPLYLGTQEFDTEDHAAMAAIVDHCTGELEGGSAAAAGGSDAAREGREVKNVSVISVDALTSGDGEAAAAGVAPDLSGITLQLCREAGIVF